MDKIWYRNLSKSEVIGHSGGDEKMNGHAKVERYKKKSEKKKHSAGCNKGV